MGLPGGSVGKESACSTGDLGSIPGSGRFPGEGNGKTTPVFLPGESHGQRSLGGYSPWGCKGSDTTEQLPLSHFHKVTSVAGLEATEVRNSMGASDKLGPFSHGVTHYVLICLFKKTP